MMLIRGKSLADMAGYLNIREQSFRNKLTRESFTAPDLIRLAEGLGARVQIDFGGKQMIVLDTSDLPREDSEE
jgi:hypothetical protein